MSLVGVVTAVTSAITGAVVSVVELSVVVVDSSRSTSFFFTAGVDTQTKT